MGSGTVGGPAINTTRARQFSPENVKLLTLEPQSRGDQEAQAADGGCADAGSVRGNGITEQGGRKQVGRNRIQAGWREVEANTTQGQKRQNSERALHFQVDRATGARFTLLPETTEIRSKHTICGFQTCRTTMQKSQETDQVSPRASLSFLHSQRLGHGPRRGQVMLSKSSEWRQQAENAGGPR